MARGVSGDGRTDPFMDRLRALNSRDPRIAARGVDRLRTRGADAGDDEKSLITPTHPQASTGDDAMDSPAPWGRASDFLEKDIHDRMRRAMRRHRVDDTPVTGGYDPNADIHRHGRGSIVSSVAVVIGSILIIAVMVMAMSPGLTIMDEPSVVTAPEVMEG